MSNMLDSEKSDVDFFPSALKQIERVLMDDYALPRAYARHGSAADCVCDRDRLDVVGSEGRFVAAARTLLASFVDPNLRIVVPGTTREEPGISTREYRGRLYVTEARADCPLTPCQTISYIDDVPLEVYLDNAKWMQGIEEDRRPWDVCLAAARTLTVAGGASAPVPLASDDGVNRTKAAWIEGGTLYCRLDRLEGFDVPKEAKRLILDLRTCAMGSDEDVEALLAYMVSEETRLASLFDEKWVTNCSVKNCERKARALKAIADVGGEMGKQAAELAETVLRRAGTGFVREDYSGDFEDRSIKPNGNVNVAILSDMFTAGAAERLVAAAKLCPKCVVVGRRTSGSIDTAEQCACDLGRGYSLLYTTSAREELYLAEASEVRGVVPDVRVLWTPAHIDASGSRPITEDPDVRAAMGLLRQLA